MHERSHCVSYLVNDVFEYCWSYEAISYRSSWRIVMSVGVSGQGEIDSKMPCSSVSEKCYRRICRIPPLHANPDGSKFLRQRLDLHQFPLFSDHCSAFWNICKELCISQNMPILCNFQRMTDDLVLCVQLPFLINNH